MSSVEVESDRLEVGIEVRPDNPRRVEQIKIGREIYAICCDEMADSITLIEPYLKLARLTW